jgi:hypothetical protein
MSRENQEGLGMNGTHQLLAFADDVNLVGQTTDDPVRLGFSRRKYRQN